MRKNFLDISYNFEIDADTAEGQNVLMEIGKVIAGRIKAGSSPTLYRDGLVEQRKGGKLLEQWPGSRCIEMLIKSPNFCRITGIDSTSLIDGRQLL